MTSRKLGWVALVSWLVFGACGGQAGTGSNSNWQECKTTADCAPLPGTVCVNDRCATGSQNGVADAGLDAATCAQRTASMDTEVQKAAAAADTACATDADCVGVGLANACYESCSVVAVSRTGAASLRNALDDIEQTECASFESAGCSVLRLPCIAWPSPACRAGRCEAGPSQATMVDAGGARSCAAGAGTVTQQNGEDWASMSVLAYCTAVGCPIRTRAEALAGYDCTTFSDAGAYAVTRMLCPNDDSFRFSRTTGVTEMDFDTTTGELVGLAISSDTPFGPCNVKHYQAGSLLIDCGSKVMMGCSAR